MQKKPPGFQKSVRSEEDDNSDIDSIAVVELARRIPEFLYECEYRGHSPRTLEEERVVLVKLLRYLRNPTATIAAVWKFVNISI